MTEPYGIVWEEAAGRLVVAADQDAEWYGAVAASVVRAGDARAADIGCGGAGMAEALARALPGGTVLGVDGDPAVLAAAIQRVPGGVTFVRADLDGDLAPVREAAGGALDVVWASASVHHAGDQQRAVDTLAGLLGTGGRLVLAEGGLPVRCLPWDLGIGEPGLEIRLDAAQDRWFARMRAQLPGTVPMPYGWAEALTRAGLRYAGTRSWLFESRTPLDRADVERVVDELAHRVDRLRPTDLLDPADLATWDRLLDGSDPAWLGGRGDLQRLTARSVHIGLRE
jgi:SAM-dependent methyltransferase